MLRDDSVSEKCPDDVTALFLCCVGGSAHRHLTKACGHGLFDFLQIFCQKNPKSWELLENKTDVRVDLHWGGRLAEMTAGNQWGQTQVAALDRDSKPGELVSSHLVWLMSFTFLQPYIIHGHSERMLKLKGFHGQKCSQKWGFLGWQIYPLEAYILKVERSADFGLLSKQMEKAHKSRRQNCA